MEMEIKYVYITVLSVAMTVSFLMYCNNLFRVWADAFNDALKKISYWKWHLVWRDPKVWTAEDWLVVGIVTGFAGNALDNLYWGATWTLLLFQHEFGLWMLSIGPVANVLFRQSISTWAVYGHLRAAKIMNEEAIDIPHKRYWGAFGLSLIALLVLI